MTAVEHEDIQGNLLNAYGLPFAAYVSVRIEDAVQGRALVGALHPRVTSHAARPDGRTPSETLNVAISHAGLRRLGMPARILDRFPPEFADGMARRSAQLGDIGASASELWQPGLREGEIHLLAIVHADSAAARAAGLRRLDDEVARHDRLTAGEPELGSAESVREHFGFADGFGQPAVDGELRGPYRGQGVPVGGRRLWRLTITPRRWRRIRTGEFVLGYPDEDGVVPDVPPRDWAANGTFMVYRKLEQDVVGFRRLLDELALRHFSGDRWRAAAKITGRWPDGTPLMTRPDGPDPALAQSKERTNDFRYADDPEGYLCPIGSHIRRANPRDSLPGGGARTRRHRIIRRGMPYGDPLPEGMQDGAERGLIFVCFNASIARQFEVVNGWLRDGRAFGLPHGDLITDPTGAPAMTVQGDPPIELRPARSRPLVRTRGGEYLFMPGLRALRKLADL